jgi:hypothetical protein
MRISRVIALLLAVAMVMPGLVFADGISFPDLGADHWAHSAVMTLVGDGTIKGFEDGTFRPDATVSRAEFVKMIGMGPERRSADYGDVDKSHWGYDYIMTSGMNADASGNFNPEVAITRYDVAELIWKRNGSVTGVLLLSSSQTRAATPRRLHGFTTTVLWLVTMALT